jgi:hypothetical protein
MTDFIRLIKHFIDEHEHKTEQINETEQICRLEKIIQDYKQTKNLSRLDDVEITHSDLINDILSEDYDIKSNVLDLFESMSNKTIIKLIEYEEYKKHKDNIECKSLIHIACKQNLGALVIWLINKGFSYNSRENSLAIATNGNFELIQFYINLNNDFSPYFLRTLIEFNYIFIIQWLFHTNNVDKKGIDYKYLLHHAVKWNRVYILEYLYHEQKLNFYDDVYILDLDFKFRDKKITKETLTWLWKNGFKWTFEQANKFESKFMLDLMT